MSTNNKHVNGISPIPDKDESAHSSSPEELEVILGHIGSGGETICPYVQSHKRCRVMPESRNPLSGDML